MKIKKALPVLLIIIVFASCTSNENANSQTDSLELAQAEPEKTEFIGTNEDIQKYDSIIAYSKKQHLNEKKFSEIEIEVARQLLDIPYVAATLEQDSAEQLVVNLRGLDCTTFLENVVAISYCIKAGNTNFNHYCKILQLFRYRGGKIDKYPSRLHYFTDWLLDNEQKGLIKIVSNEFGNADFDPTVGFMSKNPDKYKQLTKHPEFVQLIANQEDLLAKAKLNYLTKDQIEANASKIKDGDLIAFSTTINGLDVSHVAIAAFHNRRLHFYHASSSKKKVILSEKPMSEYLAGMKRNDGILVARIVE
jgi:hypothetical protein